MGRGVWGVVARVSDSGVTVGTLRSGFRNSPPGQDAMTERVLNTETETPNPEFH